MEKIRAGPPPVLRPPRRLAEDPGPGPPTSLGSTRTPAPLGGSLSRPATQPSSSLALSPASHDAGLFRDRPDCQRAA